MFKRNKLSAVIALVTGLSALPMTIMAGGGHGHGHGHDDDDDDNHKKSFVLTGNCAQLPADRTTEFHGNPATSNLNLAMAGNQWVVFDHLHAGVQRASRCTWRKEHRSHRHR